MIQQLKRNGNNNMKAMMIMIILTTTISTITIIEDNAENHNNNDNAVDHESTDKFPLHKILSLYCKKYRSQLLKRKVFRNEILERNWEEKGGKWMRRGTGGQVDEAKDKGVGG